MAFNDRNELMSVNEAPLDESNNPLSELPIEITQSLTPAKNRMILLYLTGQYTQRKIAATIGVSENTVRKWLMDENVQTVIKAFQEREFAIIDSRIKAMQHKAIDTLNDLMDSNMDNVRYQASKDILDRSGHKPQQSIKVDKTVTNLEQVLTNLADFNVEEVEAIDITEFTELVKSE